MLLGRTPRIFAGLLMVYTLLAGADYWGPGYLAAMGSFLIFVPYLSIYIFHRIGIPGLLEHNGLCGWGWCAPTASDGCSSSLSGWESPGALPGDC